MAKDSDSASGSAELPMTAKQVTDILLKFAQPLLDTAPDGVSAEQLQGALNLAATVWDAVVTDDAIGVGVEISLQRVLDDTSQQTPKMVPLLGSLANRKRRLFPDSDFLIGGIEVVEAEGGGFTIRAEAAPV